MQKFITIENLHAMAFSIHLMKKIIKRKYFSTRDKSYMVFNVRPHRDTYDTCESRIFSVFLDHPGSNVFPDIFTSLPSVDYPPQAFRRQKWLSSDRHSVLKCYSHFLHSFVEFCLYLHIY